MTQFQQDLIKIGVDKGLLALVAVIFGYILSRGLERYKARTIYLHTLAERKLEAFASVGIILEELLMKIHAIMLDVGKWPGSTPEQGERLVESLIERYGIFWNAFYDNIPKVMHVATTYMPSNVSPLFNRHQKLLDEFNHLIKHFQELPDGIAQMKDITDKLEAAVRELQFGLRQEMAKPPF